MVSEYSEEEITHVYQRMENNGSTDFEALREILCMDFGYYFSPQYSPAG